MQVGGLCWGGTGLTLNDDYVEVEMSGDNIEVKGLKPGKKYTISITMNGPAVTVKITD